MEEQTAAAQGPAAKNNFAVLALKELSKVDKGLEKLAQTYSNVVYDVATTRGMEQAKKARQSIRDVRYKVEHIRKDEASRIKAAQTALNSEAERIKAAILAIEDPIDAQITAEEERKQREKEEAERKERERVDQIRGEIDRLAGTPARVEADGLSAEQIQAIITATGSTALDADFYKEFLGEAEFTRAKVVSELHTLIAKIKLREEEAARVASQQAEIEELRRKLAEANALLAAQSAAAPAEPAAVAHPAGGVIESLYKGEHIDPGTESWTAVVEIASAEFGAEANALPIDIADVSEERLFDDEYPGTDRVVLAVATHFGVSDEVAKRYITQAGEDLAFQGA